jgi:hypothetical protein
LAFLCCIISKLNKFNILLRLESQKSGICLPGCRQLLKLYIHAEKHATINTTLPALYKTTHIFSLSQTANERKQSVLNAVASIKHDEMTLTFHFRELY